MEAAQGALRHGVLYDLLEREHDRDRPALRHRGPAPGPQIHRSTPRRLKRVSKVARLLYVQLNAAARGGCTASRGRPALSAQARAGPRNCMKSAARSPTATTTSTAPTSWTTPTRPASPSPSCTASSLLVLGPPRQAAQARSQPRRPGLFIQQLLCLRLAVILCHARRDPDLKGLQLECGAEPGRIFVLNCRAGWAASLFPQSAHLLQEEVLAWQKTPWRVELSRLLRRLQEFGRLDGHHHGLDVAVALARANPPDRPLAHRAAVPLKPQQQRDRLPQRRLVADQQHHRLAVRPAGGRQQRIGVVSGASSVRILNLRPSARAVCSQRRAGLQMIRVPSGSWRSSQATRRLACFSPRAVSERCISS